MGFLDHLQEQGIDVVRQILTNTTKEAHHAGEVHAEPNSYCTSLSCKRNWSIVFAVVLFLEGIIFGYVALFLRRYACMSTRRFRKMLHFVNIGGGGVFLATGLLHILPEAVELLSHEAKPEAHAEPGGKPHAEPATAHESHAAEFPTAFAIILGTFLVFLFFDRVLFRHGDDVKPIIDPLEDDEDVSEDAENALSDELEDEAGHYNGFGSPKFFSSMLTVIGISAHSLFESIALGSSNNFSTILSTFIAIAAHRWATSMALGSRFAKDSLATAPYSLLNLIFALIAPLGIFIGFAVKETSHIFQGIIFALSAGTFIYIGAFETTAEEFVAHNKWYFGKFCTMLAGAGLMLIITGVLVAADVH